MLEVNFESFICLGAQVDSHFEMVVFYAKVYTEKVFSLPRFFIDLPLKSRFTYWEFM